MTRSDGLPIWVSQAEAEARPLQRIDLGSKSAASQYNEAWLQALLHEHPEIFPVDQIEPGFGKLIAVCRELPLRSGYLDNLFITREGRLAIVETKLWRNPEARRAAVAQLMDYAAAIFSMSYGDLEAAVAKARGLRDHHPDYLFSIVNDTEGDAASFVDAVSWNLRQGRAILAVVGDGIREDIMPLSQLLQSHAGHRFTFSLVELAVYENPSAPGHLVIPSLLAQTALIERGVIRVESRDVVIEAAKLNVSLVSTAKRMGINEDEFYETLAATCPGQRDPLKAFVTEAEELGFYEEFQGGLNLKHASPKGMPLNVVAITKTGIVDTGPASWGDRAHAGQAYSATIAKLIGGSLNYSANGSCWVKTSQGKMPKVSDLLLRHKDDWLQAMIRYVKTITEQYCSYPLPEQSPLGHPQHGTPEVVDRLTPPHADQLASTWPE